jgi:hypothetical protein
MEVKHTLIHILVYCIYLYSSLTGPVYIIYIIFNIQYSTSYWTAYDTPICTVPGTVRRTVSGAAGTREVR